MNIAMTKKLADAYKIKIEKAESEEVSITNWHANIFYFERKKCIHFMNDRSKFSLGLFYVSIANMKNIETLLKEAIGETLIIYGVDVNIINRYLEDCASVSFSKTFNRQILGCMNQDIYFITWDMAEFLDFDHMNQVIVRIYLKKTVRFIEVLN